MAVELGRTKGGKAKIVASELEKPELDDRFYRVIKLSNDLEALVVHDPDTDKASAAMDVHVGSFSDDEDLQGQAHAVEHLLFMGTKKYPTENEYSKFLAEHSGSSNAYTASTSTNYYFEVGHEHFYGALDRFAQFFISPLFLVETLDRELMAVDSENKKNLQNDMWRIYQLSRTLSNPPYCHFSTGNLQTLKEWPEKKGLNVRDEFMKFHDKYYSSNTMKLVVLGREDLDTLQNWVEELFEGVQNKNLPDPKFEGQPLTEEHLMTQIFAKPVMDIRRLELSFPFLDEEELFESHPSRYASHLIGHEGPGSILAYLKQKGWASGLSAGAIHVASGSAFFQIGIRLTEDGLGHYEDVVKIIFHYINLIKDTPVQEWVVKEMQNVAAVDFKFRQKSPASKFTSGQAAIMQKPFPREWLMSGMSLIRKYDPKLISEALSYLRPNNFRLRLAARKCPRGEFDRVERWYKTEYRVEKIPQEFLQALNDTVGVGKGIGEELQGKLYLPHANEFIPTNFTVQKKEVEKPQKVPTLIKNTDLVKIWYKKDDTFWVPKANVYITLRNPMVYASPANAVAAEIYCELVKDALNEYAYNAEIAGLEYFVSASSIGLEVEVSGYNDKMSVLLEKVIRVMKNLVIRPDRFKIVKENKLRAYQNWIYEQPYYQVGEYVKYMNSQTVWLKEETLIELECLTLEDISSFYPKLLKQTYIEALVHGNLYKEDALRFVDLVKSILSPRPLPPTQFGVRRSLILPSGGKYVWKRPLLDPQNVNSVIGYTLFVGEQNEVRLRNLLVVFSQISEEPCFDQLRTKEQLGYIVFSGYRYSATTMSYRVIVQSERTASYLEIRIEEFLRSFRQKLDGMTDKEFQTYVKSVIVRKTESLKNLNQESNRLWNYIGNEMYDFEQIESDVAVLQTISKSEVIDFYNTFISPDSEVRSKASIQMHAASVPGNDERPAIVDVLIKVFSDAGITSTAEEITKVLENLDIHNVDSVVFGVNAYLKGLKNISPSLIGEILEKGREAIKHSITAQNEILDRVEEVVAWKASRRATAGPRPIKPLVEFENTEVKL